MKRFEKLIGNSPAMHRVYQQIQQAAKTEIPIFLVGETGTGKDLAAQAIHNRSLRKEETYIPVNLGSIPSQLVASELFGHEKGSFTGAFKQYQGKFEQADKGTVFLDEIDAIDEKIQVSLLRLIEQKKFHRLGGTEPISTDVRLIIATNADIDDMVSENVFREDLFYRLDIFRIQLPALRNRKSDIQPLVKHFINQFNKIYSKKIKNISTESYAALENYAWPGNVRELKNVIQRACLICEEEQIEKIHLPARFKQLSDNKSMDTISFKIGTPLDVIERNTIIKTLQRTANNRTEAARLLGISRRALYNRLNKHNLI